MVLAWLLAGRLSTRKTAKKMSAEAEEVGGWGERQADSKSLDHHAFVRHVLSVCLSVRPSLSLSLSLRNDVARVHHFQHRLIHRRYQQPPPPVHPSPAKIHDQLSVFASHRSRSKRLSILSLNYRRIPRFFLCILSAWGRQAASPSQHTYAHLSESVTKSSSLSLSTLVLCGIWGRTFTETPEGGDSPSRPLRESSRTVPCQLSPPWCSHSTEPVTWPETLEKARIPPFSTIALVPNV
jgi:hypothetical protein